MTVPDQKHWALIIVTALLYLTRTEGTLEIRQLCTKEQTTLLFDGKECNDGGIIELYPGEVSSAWHCCSGISFDDVFVEVSVSVGGILFNSTVSLQNLTTPAFGPNNEGKPWQLYAWEGQIHLSPNFTGQFIPYLWKDVVISGNKTVARHHDCKLYVLPSISTIQPNSTLSTTTESSAPALYTLNKTLHSTLLLFVAFLSRAVGFKTCLLQ